MLFSCFADALKLFPLKKDYCLNYLKPSKTYGIAVLIKVTLQ